MLLFVSLDPSATCAALRKGNTKRPNRCVLILSLSLSSLSNNAVAWFVIREVVVKAWTGRHGSRETGGWVGLARNVGRRPRMRNPYSKLVNPETQRVTSVQCGRNESRTTGS